MIDEVPLRLGLNPKAIHSVTQRYSSKQVLESEPFDALAPAPAPQTKDHALLQLRIERLVSFLRRVKIEGLSRLAELDVSSIKAPLGRPSLNGKARKAALFIVKCNDKNIRPSAKDVAKETGYTVRGFLTHCRKSLRENYDLKNAGGYFFEVDSEIHKILKSP